MRFLLLFAVLFVGTPVHALTDAQTLPLLAAMGEYRAAYPLAINEAKRHNTLAAWAAVYQQPEYAGFTAPLNRAQVYAAAWQATQHSAQIDTYRQFVALAPDSVGAQLAIDAEYQLVQQQNTVASYAEFMALHPDAVQSLDALLRVQALIWALVKAVYSVAAYDKYLDAFPEAKFAAEAEPLARQLAVQPFAIKVTACQQSAERLRQEKIRQNQGEEEARDEAEKQLDRCQEKLAREVYNTARRAQTTRLSLRLYAFLDAEAAFASTSVMTAHLDREERQTHQAKLEGLLNQQLAQSKQQSEALLVALETQTGQIVGAIGQQTTTLKDAMAANTQQLVAAGERQTQRLEAGMERQSQRLETAIQRQQQALQQELSQVRRQITDGPGLASEFQRAATQSAVQVAAPLVKRAGCFATGFIPVVGPVIATACRTMI